MAVTIRNYMCQDCERPLSNEEYAYHNSDHSIKIEEFKKSEDCKIHGFVKFTDGRFSLKIELPEKIKRNNGDETEFIELIFEAGSYEFIQFLGSEETGQ